MALVRFFGIGAPRSGTSWFAHCLDEHPQVAIPIKETHFFSRDGEYAKGVETYEARLEKRWNGRGTVGEFCPNYLAVEASPQRLFDYNPDARLIAILRNPIDRAFSHFLLEVRAGQASLDRSLISQADERYEYFMHGYYHAALSRYLDVGFAREQLLVLFYEDVCAAPQTAYDAILQHIGVEPGFQPTSFDRSVNNSRVPRSTALEAVYDAVDRALSGRTVQSVRRAIARTGLPAKIRQFNSAATMPELSASDRGALRDRFAADVANLTSLLDAQHPWRDFDGARA